MKLTVCDDSREDAEALQLLCEAYFAENGLQMEVTAVNDPYAVRDEQADVLILDVEMPRLDGITLKDQLAIEPDCPLIIFATRHGDAISRAFNRNVIGFLLKPVDPRQLSDMLDVAMGYIKPDKVIDLEGETVSTGDIVRIWTEKGYTILELSSGKVTRGVRKSLEQWEEELAELGFLRVNKSCIVSSRHIRSFRDDKIVLRETKEDASPLCLTVSRRRKKECYRQYLCYLSKIAKYI